MVTIYLKKEKHVLKEPPPSKMYKFGKKEVVYEKIIVGSSMPLPTPP